MSTSNVITGTFKGENGREPQTVIVEAIRNHPFFRGLSSEYVRVLADAAMLTEFAKDQSVFEEGDPANRFYLILEGKVALESQTEGLDPVQLQTIGAGEVLGWSWLFPPYYWHFDARAIEPTRAIFFYGTRLREKAEEDPEFGYELMKRTAYVVIQRLRMARQQLLRPGH
ncbi:MAG: cyclic nucleotide-binding domain-containing protein [Verrucomicrobiota bacterium]|jgi:CRP/FNR family transcriptional regulator, cyclic AMP receptor protein